MPTVPLPEHPDIDQLRTRARELQRGVRAGAPEALHQAALDAPDAGYPLHRAQLALARHHGFPSWPRMLHAVAAISARTWTPADPPPGEPPGDRFLRLACVDAGAARPGQAQEAAALLGRHPELPSSGLAVAAACADVAAVAGHLAADPAAATRPAGPHGWPPLMYLTYSRVDAGVEATLACARLLLAGGADPDDGRFLRGLPTPFTVLTGVFGGGEDDPPPHPHAVPLARLLLEHGAEPNDGQTLYNRMFGSADHFLHVLFPFGLGRGDGGPWRRLLPDVLDPPDVLVRKLLGWAVLHDQRDRVALLARHGVDLAAPLRSRRTPVEEALRSGHPELAALLQELGAPPPALNRVDAFVAAALAGDAAAVAAASPALVDAVRRTRPALVVWAAAQGRPAAVELLVAAGFDIDALGRGDLPLEQPWQTALHTAVERGDAALVGRLLALGADRRVRDRRFDGTAADWADHLGRPELAELLRRP